MQMSKWMPGSISQKREKKYIHLFKVRDLGDANWKKMKFFMAMWNKETTDAPAKKGNLIQI